MSYRILDRLVAPAGYFVMELAVKRKNGVLNFGIEKKPIVYWAFLSEDASKDIYSDRPYPGTLEGIETDWGAYQHPDGKVYVPYGGDCGETLIFETVDAWFDIELEERKASIAKLEIKRAEKDCK